MGRVERRVAAGILLIGLVGCAHQPLPSEEIRDALGTVGVVSGRFTPQVKLRTPAKGRLSGAWREGVRGAVVGVLAGAPSTDFFTPLPILLGAALGLTASSVIGGVYGALTALPAEPIEEAEARLKTVLAGLTIQEAMRDRIFRVLQDRRNDRSVLLTDKGPGAPDEPITYRSLSDNGIDTILEVAVQVVGLDGHWAADPALAVLITVRTRLLRSLDDTVLSAHTFEYRSGKGRFTEWASSDAKGFLKELDRGYARLADRIVETLIIGASRQPDSRTIDVP